MIPSGTIRENKNYSSSLIAFIFGPNMERAALLSETYVYAQQAG